MNPFIVIPTFLVHVVSAHTRVIPGLVCVRHSSVYNGIQARCHIFRAWCVYVCHAHLERCAVFFSCYHRHCCPSVWCLHWNSSYALADLKRVGSALDSWSSGTWAVKV